MKDDPEHGNAPGNADLPIGSSGILGKVNHEIGEEDNKEKARANREIGVPGWHSRGYLPHFQSNDKTQHVTFHLADSLPKKVLERLRDEIQFLPEKTREVEWRKRVEAWLDAGHGSCILREPLIGRMVQNAFLFFDGQRHRLIDWVVMPNHVHVLFQPISGWAVAGIVASWKKFTATRICAFRRQNANHPMGDLLEPVWHREYWDRFIRDSRHFQRAVDYIHQNPVKAGLVPTPGDWLWSSARNGNANLSIGDEGNKETARANREIGVPRKEP
jgi:REP element-mobilizing transposase RayT